MVQSWRDKYVDILVQENSQKGLEKIEKKITKLKKLLGLTFFSKILIRLEDHLDRIKTDWDMSPPRSM